MAVYRIYLVHDDGRLQPGAGGGGARGEDAIVRLRPPCRADFRAELWQGGRFIAVAVTVRRHGFAHPHPAG